MNRMRINDGVPPFLDPRKALLAWTPRGDTSSSTAGMVHIGRLIKDHKSSDWTEGFTCTGGAAYVMRRKLSPELALREWMYDFIVLVIRDGLDPYELYREFSKIYGWTDLFGDLPLLLRREEWK